MPSPTLPIIAIVGPTASGKTARAVSLARALGRAEIVSADSRQVYRDMDIGTGKDIAEYAGVPYHLIDVAPAGHKYNLYQYLRDYRSAMAAIAGRGATPIVCGGTGMYVEAALKGLMLPEVPEDPALRASLAHLSLGELTERLAALKQMHNTTDVDTPARAIRAIEICHYYQQHPELAAGSGGRYAEAISPFVVIGVDVPRDVRRANIARRLSHRLDHEDMLGETRRLLEAGVAADTLIGYGLEYRYLTLHLLGQLSYQEMHERLLTAIQQFAKRQMTWWRGMERRGIAIRWLPYDMPPDEMNHSIITLAQDPQSWTYGPFC